LSLLSISLTLLRTLGIFYQKALRVYPDTPRIRVFKQILHPHAGQARIKKFIMPVAIVNPKKITDNDRFFNIKKEAIVPIINIKIRIVCLFQIGI